MKTPLFTSLMEHKRKNSLSLHVPGHKNGSVFFGPAIKIYKDVLSFDFTELTGLDDLHHAEGIIYEAEQLTAKLYGVKDTKFLVNGSTVGNLAMILACCRPGETILVQRNSHKSIINGIKLAGARPVFLNPIIDERLDVPSYVNYETIKIALETFPFAKAIILTNPNYYGLAIDLTSIVNLVHSYDIPVLVDEAHGAHFLLGKPFPKSAISAGADVIIQSAHKTLPAMTMGSYLHFNSTLVNKEKLFYYLTVLQSSSPSYPIMASLDLARAFLQEIVEKGYKDNILKNLTVIKEYLHATGKFIIVNSNDKHVYMDPLKLTIKSSEGLTGLELLHFFEKHNIYGELSDPTKLLLVLPLSAEDSIVDKLKNVNFNNVKSLGRREHIAKANTIQLTEFISSLEKSYSELEEFKKQQVPLSESLGLIAAESIVPYPPGIPLIMEGERITEQLIEQLTELVRVGINIQGDKHIRTGNILVYNESR
ncbi:aminotransferase class I/II-fold pyridoxal phosphate-dependent enzyme [Metabacillus malikii]|uniref:Arginine/lysine/ornithine decarboxylase n=1 Tax=Metabacillus malikii TaxID=1504265 RepID=A0ABT9ZNK8_9BACI|nr:aminotransferase class I/II-fold pyridoxal phosphate-dependent enzyme [Metabacillus malikii]MDQ0233376.1 arginine/lysine/ornithine decarboxylase [Metabacillus malikii]